MECIIESLVKKIGLSSNQLLKCVLLNTAIELFSYIDAPAYSSSGFLYHDWSMEDFDHLCNAPPDAGQILESADIWPHFLPSDRITDQAGLNQNPSVAEDTACITSVDELETMYLPITENLCVQAGPVHEKLDSNCLNNNNLGNSESFYYLVGPVNLWLEFPLALDMQATPAPPADNFHFCFGLCNETNKQEVVVNNCGVQTMEEPLLTKPNETLENLQGESFSVSLNHESEAKSILWDYYDLHQSRRHMECAQTNTWEPKYQDISNTGDLFSLVEEEMILLAHQEVENLLYTDLYPACREMYPHKNAAQHLGEQPLSSTPCVEKTRTRPLQSKGDVHVKNLKNTLFDR